MKNRSIHQLPALLGAGALCLASFAAMAKENLACYQDQRTDAMTCYDANGVWEKDGIRWSKLYTGGPKNIRPTSISIHVNCRTNVVHLKDRDGVSFAGGYGNETQALSNLRRWICEEKRVKK